MEFLNFINDIGFEKNWIMEYSLSIKEDNKNIINLDCDIKDFYILYSIYYCMKYTNNKVIFVTSDINEISYYFSKILDRAKISSELYSFKKNMVKFYNGSFIEIIPLSVVTNNTLNSNLLIIDITTFNTRIGEYIIYNTILNENKNFDILCSVKNIKSSYCFSDLIVNCIEYRIPVIKLED